MLLKASGQSSESSRHLDLHNDFIMCPSFSHGGVYEAQANFVRISLQLFFLTAALSFTMVVFSLSLKSLLSCVFSGIKVSVHLASVHCLFFTAFVQDRSLAIRRNRTKYLNEWQVILCTLCLRRKGKGAGIEGAALYASRLRATYQSLAFVLNVTLLVQSARGEGGSISSQKKHSCTAGYGFKGLFLRLSYS